MNYLGLMIVSLLIAVICLVIVAKRLVTCYKKKTYPKIFKDQKRMSGRPESLFNDSTRLFRHFCRTLVVTSFHRISYTCFTNKCLSITSGYLIFDIFFDGARM